MESGRRQRREESQQPLEGIGVRVEGSGAGLGGVFFGGRAEQASGIYRLAAERCDRESRLWWRGLRWKAGKTGWPITSSINTRRYLPKAFADEDFAFYGKTLFGANEQFPRWRRGLLLVNAELGDDLGQIYIKRYFAPEVKAQVQELVANLIAVYRKRIQAVRWMTPSTKAEALRKLDTL